MAIPIGAPRIPTSTIEQLAAQSPAFRQAQAEYQQRSRGLSPEEADRLWLDILRTTGQTNVGDNGTVAFGNSHYRLQPDGTATEHRTGLEKVGQAVGTAAVVASPILIGAGWPQGQTSPSEPEASPHVNSNDLPGQIRSLTGNGGGGGGLGDLSSLLGPALTAAVPLIGRAVGGQGGGLGSGPGIPPELTQLLQEAMRRMQAQEPLFQQVNQQALAGLPSSTLRPPPLGMEDPWPRF